ncbi:hypothetical protein RvY_11845 [Ramazzottius varieornatus]|uniref:DDE Tnp4 domain-containing protein n=1 Tax=Ramazzottius varieornatus TaxID=947166 RepID=A0A1D1VMV2_RAMVA|nr:hypothetical protein RvY_11845 [Ramazzottius varieornatus]
MLPDPTTISNYVGSEARKIRESLLEEIRPILRMNGGGCTVHHMYGNSELRERLLLCSEWDSVDRKTGPAVQKFVFRKLREIGLEEDLKLCTLVTDQGGNIKVAFRDSDFEHINCAGHLLNTCLQACFKTKAKSQYPMPAEAVPTLTLINQLKALVTHCKQGGISRQLGTTLKQHWNTHVEMLASVLATYDELKVILANRNELQLLPTSSQRIQEIHDLFEPTPTLHLVAPAYMEIIRHFKEYAPSDFADIRTLQKHAENVFTKKLQIDEIRKRAVFLDPSMKHLNFLKADERVAVLTRVMAEVQKVSMPEKIGAPTAEAVNVAAKKPPKFNLKAMATYSTDRPIENEVEKYLRLPSPPEDQDVWSFWIEKQKDLPRMSSYALRCLSVPGTSTPSERLFSRSGTAVDEKRTSLDRQTLSDLMVIQSNYECSAAHAARFRALNQTIWFKPLAALSVGLCLDRDNLDACGTDEHRVSYTARKRLISDLEEWEVRRKLMKLNLDLAEAEEEKDGADIATVLLQLICATRYLHRPEVLKSTHFVQYVLPLLDDERFKQGVRMSRDVFERILGRISDHNTSEVTWPNKNERTSIKARVLADSGFPDCVGMLDGTLIPQEYKPKKDEDYWSHKSRYGISGMIVCDDKRKIRYVFVGFCGSVHDMRVYSNARLASLTSKLFTTGEYLLADSAYTTSAVTVSSYKRPSSLVEDNEQFNFYLASIRIRVKHAIGIPKGHFPSLQSLRIKIFDKETHERAVRWIKACVVLHNMLLKDSYFDSSWTKYRERITSDSPQECATVDGKSFETA